MHAHPEHPENSFSRREGRFPGFLRSAQSGSCNARKATCYASGATFYATLPVMTTQFILRAQKMDAAGRCPVHLIVYLDGARLVQATGEKCKPADWNADR